MNMLLISNHPARHSGSEKRNKSTCHLSAGWEVILVIFELKFNEIYHGSISLLVFSVNLGIMFLLMQL